MGLIDKDKLEKLINEGLTTQQIADRLELSRATITRNKTYYGFRSKYYYNKHNTKKCENCETEFDSLISENRKFCSQSCAAIFVNLSKGDKKLVEYGLIKIEEELYKKCLNCEADFLIDRKRMSEIRKFCSTDCHRKYEEKHKRTSVCSYINVDWLLISWRR